MYDGQVFWLAQKRLSTGRFQAWPKNESTSSRALDPHQLHALLGNGDPTATHTAPLWRPLSGGIKS